MEAPKGEDIWLCLDMRLQNLAVKRVRHTIPIVDDVLQEIMNGCKILSKIDEQNANHHIELDEQSREIYNVCNTQGTVPI